MHWQSGSTLVESFPKYSSPVNRYIYMFVSTWTNFFYLLNVLRHNYKTCKCSSPNCVVLSAVASKNFIPILVWVLCWNFKRRTRTIFYRYYLDFTFFRPNLWMAQMKRAAFQWSRWKLRGFLERYIKVLKDLWYFRGQNSSLNNASIVSDHTRMKRFQET